MFKFLKKGEEEEREINFVKGLSYGLGGALIILIIILLIVFGGRIKNKMVGGDQDLENVTESTAKLRITIVTSKNCNENCFDINLFLDALRQNDIYETGTETIYIEDSQGKKLVDQYGITKVPTVLVAGELDKNDQLAQAWPVLGEVIDGVFVFRELIPPYIEVASGNLRGQFSTTYLTDESCEDCYDVNVHMVALNNLGLTVGESSTFDVSSDQGKELLDKYSITKVPTIILSGDLSEYQGLQQVWPLVGEVTSDGSYVFTKMEEMGTYRDLDTGEVVEVELPEATPEATPEVIPEVVQ